MLTIPTETNTQRHPHTQREEQAIALSSLKHNNRK
jgi:hypothetical protein